MLIDKLNQTITFLRSQTKIKPSVGVILGSGLGSFASQIKVEKTISYKDIPNFSVPSIEGHSGQMIFGTVDNTQVVCLQGRVHYYEGHSIQSVVYPMRTLARLGIQTLFVTNAAGGLDPAMEPGDFMIINDHINLMNTNPLIGPNDQALGPRFPDMTEAYSTPLQEKLAEILTTHKIRFHRGIYCALSGPTYETPAEVRHLRMIGGSAVGMSTVPEVIVANHMGVKVCGISCITNKAAGLSQHKLSHTEVTETAKHVETQFTAFVREFISSLPS
jgi:purine-nucleoside phosphorylase